MIEVLVGTVLLCLGGVIGFTSFFYINKLQSEIKELQKKRIQDVTSQSPKRGDNERKEEVERIKKIDEFSLKDVIK